MDPLSLGLGIFGVICELSRVSMQTYKLYTAIKDFPPAFRNLRLGLEIEKERLKLWAQCMGIEKNSGINEIFRYNVDLLDLVKDILMRMTETFSDSARMLDLYSQAQSPPPANEGEGSKYYHNLPLPS